MRKSAIVRAMVPAMVFAWQMGTVSRAAEAVTCPTSQTYAVTCEVPTVTLVAEADGCVRPVPSDSAWLMGLDPTGSPAVPRRTCLFAVPDGMLFASLDCEVTWETCSENVRLAPQSEAVRDGDEATETPADPLAYDVELYPATAAVAGACEMMDGVKVVPVTVSPIRWSPRTGLLERAVSLTLRVTFAADVTSVSRPWSENHRALVQSAVVNPEAVAGATAAAPLRRAGRLLQRRTQAATAASAVLPPESGLYRTDPETNAFEYLLISPPDLFADWCWYVDQRRLVHTNLHFAVKNTAAIYADHPFGSTQSCRNAAESIHAYLREAVSNGVTYVVLGGAWLDAQNLNGYTPYFTSGDVMSLSNCVPGIYGFPREDWRQIPADLFYGCLDMNKGQKYPWDNNGDGKYIDKNDCQYNDTYPDVCVSRITLNPHNPLGGSYDRHALITNYVEKLARGEARDFAGHYRYGMSAASTGSSKLRKSGDRMYYRELEFYDGMRNMFDPLHHDSLEDDEYSTRVRYFDQYSNWRPIRSVKGMMNYTWTGGQPTLAKAMDDYYAGDRDFGFVQAHGWAQGAAQFSAYRFATATGLTLFNGGSGPCETGYPDYHVSSGGKKVLQYNVGDAAVSNPNGGALASVNNSRWSWAGGGGGFAAMSYYMLNEMLIGFNSERLDVGHAWIKGVRNYWPAGRWGNTAGWVLTEQFLYGDPLVRLPEVPNVWWMAGETGVWDHVTANWTNRVDTAKTFDAAYNVYFDIATNLNLDVAGEIAAMRLSMPVHGEDAVLTLAGTGTLRVMQSVDVAATNATLRFNVAGGVGHNGIRFLTGAGEVVFEGTNKFYVSGVSNAKRIALRGGGVTLDVDEFPAGSFPLLIAGAEGECPCVANELRSKNVGGLCRFGSLAISNSYVKLSTVDAFGNGAPMAQALAGSTLEIAANVYYQRSGFPEGLNATFLVDGDSAVTSSVGGLWTVKHTTTFALGEGTHLTLSADTVNAGGRIVVTNVPPSTANIPSSNTVTIANASALAGDVTVGPGIRLVLKELPLSSVTSLTVGEGATIELPDDASGYWQIVPVSSKFSCADNVTFVAASDPTNRLAGSFSKTGSFFREGALYKWTGSEGDWDDYFARRHPKILFGDLADSDVTVRVASAVSPDFAFFANLRTKFAFDAAADAASALFSSVCFCGPTEFNVPCYATEYADITTGTSRFACVASPYVHVATDAGLALAGSHWTEFRFDADAVLVAVPGASLDWNADTSLVFPDLGEVRVDVGALALTATPRPIVTGLGHVWSIPDLKHLKLVQTNAEFRIVNGALCVVAGDALKGPYALSFTDTTNWNNAAWTSAGNAFPRAWNDCALDWFADAIVTNPAVGRLVLDGDVHLNALTIHAGTNDFAFGYGNDSDGFVFDVATLDLTDCHGTTDIGIDTGAAEILTESSTNGTDVLRLRCAGSGVIRLSGITVVLDRPGDWSLPAGVQGVLRVVAPQAYERFRIAKVLDGFTDSGLTVVVTDADGHVIDGFETSVSEGTLWCVPPSLEAVVPPGTNDFARLEWRDILGNVVSNVDWDASAGFRLIGTLTSGVVIAKSGFSSVWSRLSVSNDVTLYGNETLSPAQISGGNGCLALAGAFTVNADLRAHALLLHDSHLRLGPGVVMNISHGGVNLDVSGQNWEGIVGTGTIAFTDGRSSWIAIPGNLFADTLAVRTASDIVLTQNINGGNPFAACDLSGAGSFRTDWGNGNWRPVRTVQTGVSEFSGTLAAKAGSRDSGLTVVSDADVATTNKALILSGQAVAEHRLDIAKSGCVILTGSWKGPINVEGILVITNACATNGLAVTVADGGEVKIIAEDAIPLVTAVPAYVAPTYPDDLVAPDEPIVVDTRVRIVTARVGTDDMTWTRLDWRDTNGVAVADIDWAIVTNATIVATNAAARVLFDAETFDGVLHLGKTASASVTIEARAICPFVLAADSVGAIDFRLSPEPTTTCDLLYLESSTVSLQSAICVAVHNRYGGEIEAAGEVTYDATSAKYCLNVQNVNAPDYNCTFDTQYEDSITSALGFSGSGNLTYAARPDFFETSRAGRALKGASMYSYAMHSHNGNPTVAMDSRYEWSLHFVAKLPTNNGGIIFGWGNKDSGNGVAFARVSENVAGVYAWKNGGGVTLVASADVPFASTQFHAYAITHDSHTLRFYVDGTPVRAVSLEGKYPTRGFYQWFKMYGQNGSLSDGSTSVVDDFRLYLRCLTPTSVRVIAKDFPPWPEHPTAQVDVADLAWSNLYWSAEFPDGDTPVVVTSGPGSLRVDAPLTVANPLAVTGDTVPLRLVGDGQLVVARGLAASASLAVDASGLDGTNLASRAVAGAPYSRWLVKGACTGRAPTVTALPGLPNRYAAHVEFVSGYGLRLVVTAPRTAKFGSVNLNFAGGSGGSNYKVAASCVASGSEAAQMHGAHPVAGANWNDLSAGNVTETAPQLVRTDGSVQSDAAVTVRVSQVKNPYIVGKTVADRILWGYLDDGSGPVVEVSGIPFARYRAIVYRSTDNDNTVFNPVRIGETSADAMRYFGPNAWTAAGGYTLSGGTDVNWGWTSARSVLTEGANYVVSDVLTSGTLYVSSPKLSSGRACLAAIQIVEVGSIVESLAVDYSAAVTNDTTWANGDGSGLADHGLWVNDLAGNITLTQAVASVALTFDTPVTADVVRVVNEPGERFRLVPTLADFNVEEVDVTDVRGEIVFDGASVLPPIVDAAGCHVRFERCVTEPCRVTAGAVYSYAKATFAEPVSSWSWALQLEEPTDAAVFPNVGGCNLAIGVSAGTLTLGPETGNPVPQYCYGGTKDSSGTNSVLTVNGGTVVCNVAGTGTESGGSSRGLIVGTTTSAKCAPRIFVESGLFDCSRGILSPWELCGIVQKGGVIRAKGIWKGGGSGSEIDLDGGRLELGSAGIGRRTGSGGTFEIEMEGGEIRAIADTTVYAPTLLSVAAPSTLAATNDATLTVSAAIAGSGDLTIGADGAKGTVRLEDVDEWKGSVTVTSGATLEVPSGALGGTVFLETNALVNLSVPGGLVDNSYPIASNLVVRCGDDVRGHVRVNGEALPFYCQIVGGMLLNQMEPHQWSNPVTDEMASFACRFTGISNGAWRTSANWQSFDIYRWQTLDGTNAPCVADGDFRGAVVIDGECVTNVANRVVGLDALDGMDLRLAVLNGVTVTVERVERLSGDALEVWVDAASRLNLNAFGTGPFGGTLTLAVSATDGLVFDAPFPTNDLAVTYDLKGAGSVSYGAPLTNGTHVIRRAGAALGTNGYGRTVRSKKLVSFPTDSTALFSWSAATIAVDGLSEAVTPQETDVSNADPLGTCAIVRRSDGVYLDMVDRAAPFALTGVVTVASNVCLSVAVDSLADVELRVEAGATLNVTFADDLVVGDYMIASNLIVATGAKVTFNGRDIPAYGVWTGNCLSVVAHSRARRNPVTGEEMSFSYLFAAGTDGAWFTRDNWRMYQSTYQRWVALDGTKIPYMPNNGLWGPALVDGEWIAESSVRNVHLTDALEGWTLRLALYNCVTVTVDSINKFQGGSDQWLWVDATSQLVFRKFEGSGNSDGTMSFVVAASNGIVFAKNPKSGTNFHYYLTDEGSVLYEEGVNLVSHLLKRVNFALSSSGFGRVVRERRLIACTGGVSGTCGTNGVVVAVRDPLGGVTAAALGSGVVTAEDPLGACAIATRADGVYLAYVDRDGSDAYVHRTGSGENVREIGIPFAWLMRLTNGPHALLAAHDLTTNAVAAALESTGAANGIRPWQSYLLGLEPTNETDDVSCSIAFDGEGKLTFNLPHVDPARQPNASAIRYVLQYKDKLTDTWQDHSTNAQKSVTITPSDSAARFFRYRILFP